MMAPIQRVLWEIGIKSCTGQCPNKNTTPKMRRRLEIHPQKMKEANKQKHRREERRPKIGDRVNRAKRFLV